ncbi:glycerol-3-phosphate dehydrogenase [Sneathiella sp. CAU 1612]|uniref:Glycerol-3-phosphate dehydrogenase n=1 Tax=Sneathiella sedimenti TaxID=2816034 RepID=A0ABS3F6K1_9PROT|nr:glycerol-3-phosphate dehydrogenase [Sneathiella sedimenti]MBO0334111.1 glycerol-3-phosphate dehydrogenase [Sneathiella sedimenti]
MTADFDIFVIGGGINGCGVARDAAGRGYSVALCEMNDLASGTSSGSTKLIHGGLRYLEHYEFRLVRKALQEREILWANAPHIIWPLRFILPHHKGLRPAWLLRLGLFFYDHLGGRKKLPASKSLNLHKDIPGNPLKEEFSNGFEYSDCWVNDSRLVVLNAMDAAARGAIIETRTKCIAAAHKDGLWHVTTQDTASGQTTTRSARMIINAAGPWVDNIIQAASHSPTSPNVRLVQGSHIVVPKLYEHDRCYIFQNADDRIIFAIPYENDYTLVGTTDQDYDGDPENVEISDAEISYLCGAASEYFEKPVQQKDVVWTYSAVRPLFDDGATKAQEATRDYVLQWQSDEETAPLLNIFGGKITTYRRLAEAVLELAEQKLGRKSGDWTLKAPLPGGDFPMDGFPDLLSKVRDSYPFLERGQSERMLRAYGTRLFDLLEKASSIADLGTDFGCGLFEKEVRYLMDHEWARTADDILWRRSKIGIGMTKKQITALNSWMMAASGD